MAVSAFITINQTKCGCDGAIAINAYGGTPPYTYSIDSGLSYNKMPFFNNLCFGAYYVIVKDSNDFTYNQLIKLEKPTNPTVYTVKLLTTNRFLVNNSVTQTKEYTTNLFITPSLPTNTYITFNLVHSNLTKVSPVADTTTFSTSSSLLTNSGSSSFTYSYTSETISNSTIPGCQNENLIITSIVETWENNTYYNSDTFQLTTVSTKTKNGDYTCYFSSVDDTFSIENLKIFGCDCCTVNQ